MFASECLPTALPPALLSRRARATKLVASTSQPAANAQPAASTQPATRRRGRTCSAAGEHRGDCAADGQTAAGVRAPLPAENVYKRVMLKVSGEALQGDLVAGIDPKVLQSVAEEVAAAVRAGVQVAVVVGGGNYFRGASAWSSWGLERATADYVGMLATCMNALMLQSAIEGQGVEVRVQTAIEMREIAEPYIRRRAIRHLERGRVVIFGAGTGNPFMTTDTAAALRAAEIDADAFLKATKVDGIFDCDPAKHRHAKLHRQLSYRQVMLEDLKVMDETAITLCKENDVKVVVFNLTTPGNILRALRGDAEIGTTVSGSGDDWDGSWRELREAADGGAAAQ